MNSRKGVSSRCGVAAQVPGATKMLNVAGSQLSTIVKLASLLLDWAVATFGPVTQKTINTASPLARIVNFRMFLSSMVVSVRIRLESRALIIVDADTILRRRTS